MSGAYINPMCKAFPTEVSCSLPNVGAAGGEQIHNGICVLSQNIINEKMYLAIWFWLVFLIIISPLCIFYRIMTLFFDGFRTVLLTSKCNTSTVNIPLVKSAANPMFAFLSRIPAAVSTNGL